MPAWWGNPPPSAPVPEPAQPAAAGNPRHGAAAWGCGVGLGPVEPPVGVTVFRILQATTGVIPGRFAAQTALDMRASAARARHLGGRNRHDALAF